MQNVPAEAQNATLNQTKEVTMPVFFRFSMFSVIIFLAIALISKFLIPVNLLIFIISMLALSIAIVFPCLYKSTIRQIKTVKDFKNKGVLYRALSTRFLKTTMWIIYAVVTSFFMLIQFHIYNIVEWSIFLATIPVFYITYKAIHSFVNKEMKNYVVTYNSLLYTQRIVPVVMIIFYVCLFCFLGYVEHYYSFQETVNTQKHLVSDFSNIALVFEIGEIIAFYSAAKYYLLTSIFSVDSIIPLFVFGVGYLVTFINASFILSGLIIPQKEYLRIFSSLQAEDEPQKLSNYKITIICAVSFLLVVFIFVPIMAKVNFNLEQDPSFRNNREKIENMAIKYVQNVEQIDSGFYKPGTIASLKQAEMQALQKVKLSYTRIDSMLDRAFDRVEGNVDVYLDWYYSLAGEYTRIAEMLVGDLEDYMQKKMVEYLGKGEAFNNVYNELNNALEQHQQVFTQYQELKNQILAKNKITKPEDNYKVVQSISLKRFTVSSDHLDKISFASRMGVSGTMAGMAGVAGALIVKKIMSKTAVKTVVKVGAKALSKMAISKAAGSVGGTGIGAAIGGTIGAFLTCHPVVAAISAAVGGVIGAGAVGVSVDKLILELEEHLSREEFKRAIVKAINQSREEVKVEFKDKILP